MDRERLESLVSDYLDGMLAGAEADELVGALRTDPEARRYFILAADQELALDDLAQSVGEEVFPAKEEDDFVDVGAGCGVPCSPAQSSQRRRQVSRRRSVAVRGSRRLVHARAHTAGKVAAVAAAAAAVIVAAVLVTRSVPTEPGQTAQRTPTPAAASARNTEPPGREPRTISRTDPDSGLPIIDQVDPDPSSIVQVPPAPDPVIEPAVPQDTPPAATVDPKVVENKNKPDVSSGVLARAVKVRGTVRYARGAEGDWKNAVDSLAFYDGDRIDAGSGRIDIDINGAVVHVNRGAGLRLARSRVIGVDGAETESPVVALAGGEVYIEDGVGRVHVLTPDIFVRPTGTKYEVSKGSGETYVAVAEGAVAVHVLPNEEAVAADASRIDLRRLWGDPAAVAAGSRARASRGGRLEGTEKVEIDQLVRWVREADDGAAWVKASPAAMPAGALVARPGTLSKIKPAAGQTVWLSGGEYAVETLSGSGTAEAPVKYRPAPGEKVVFTKTLTVTGEHVWLWGVAFSGGEDKSLNVGPGTDLRIINASIMGRGNFTLRENAVDAEAYGCLIYRNGAAGFAVQNRSGDSFKWIVDNIVFEQGFVGINASGGAKSEIENVHIEGNILFANGFDSQGRSRSFAQILAGREDPAVTRGMRVVDNAAYLPKEDRVGVDPPRGIWLGYTSRNNRDIICTGNYVSGGKYPLYMAPWTGRIDVSRNTFLGGGEVWLATPMPGVKENAEVSKPAGIHAVKRVNRYEPGRVHVAVFNWDRLDKVKVDMEGVLKPGTAYRLVSAYDAARNDWGRSVAQGIYSGGTIEVPMKSGRSKWEPEFGAFILLRDYMPKEDLELLSKMRTSWANSFGK
jgi:hypothetical protein